MIAKDTKIRIGFRFICLYSHAVWSSLPNVPATLTVLKGQLIDLPTRNHDQHMLAIVILPTPAGRFNPISTPFPGKAQGGDCTLFIKVGGYFDGFHNSI
jgi:hypothetical protein